MGADGWITLLNADKFDAKYGKDTRYKFVHVYERALAIGDQKLRIYHVYEDTSSGQVDYISKEDLDLYYKVIEDSEVVIDVWEVWT